MEVENTGQTEFRPQNSVGDQPSRKNILNQKGNSIIIIGVIFIILVVGVTTYLLITQRSKTQNINENNFSQPTNPTATPSLSQVKDTDVIDKLNAEALIKIPFVRDGNIYLYEDGKEKLVAIPSQKSTETACYNLVYPFLSPNGEYIAYIEQVGNQPGMGGCYGGVLRIVNLDTGKIKATNYKIGYFKWNSSNQIVFSPWQERGSDPQTYIVKEMFYDPATEKEIVFNTVIEEYKHTYEDTMVSGEFPFDDRKLIKYKDKKYYLADKSVNKESFLFDKSQVENFLDWSPNGRYAIFERKRSNEPLIFIEIELVVDTLNPNSAPKEIAVGRGGAGGDFSTGRKWYFEKAFVAYCIENLYYVDGTKPLELTNDGGGGCHNAEGFVATSPNGEYAFVKFKDRFELHTKTGERKIRVLCQDGTRNSFL